MLTAIKLLEVLIATGKKASELSSIMDVYPQVLKNVIVTDKQQTLDSEIVKKAVARATEELGNNGRVLLRASGTEPVLRVMAEAGTFSACEQHVDAIIESMRSGGFLIRVK